MTRAKALAVACLMFLALAPLAAQDDAAASRNTASPEDRIRQLENDLRVYKENYARLEELFQRAVTLAQKVIDESGALAAELAEFLKENRELTTEVDRSLEESRAVIDFLKNKVYERPTLLLETELSWRVLLGASLGFSFVWEPLPWLGLKAGAELWYTDAFRPAFPLALRLRFGLDTP
jgi:Skp family chaperone for outer membrane proteins